jgi:hypothetical protein
VDVLPQELLGDSVVQEVRCFEFSHAFLFSGGFSVSSADFLAPVSQLLTKAFWVKAFIWFGR